MSNINNTFNAVIKNPTQATALAAANTVSEAARGAGLNVLKKDGSIFQNERLFTARPRYASNTLTYVDGSGSDRGGDRGDWAYIKLLTSDTQFKEYQSGSTKRDLVYKNLIGTSGIVTEMANNGPAMSNVGYDRFLITSVACDMSEKVQISEVFGDGEVVYYFGRQPLVFNIGGLLIDSIDNNWFVEWIQIYSEFLRGSQAAKNYELIKIVLPNMTITGTISNFSWRQDSNRDTDIPFTFQFIAKIVQPNIMPEGPMVNSNQLKGVNFDKAKIMSQAEINSLKLQNKNFLNTISNPKSSLRDKGAALSAIGSGAGGILGIADEKTKGALGGIQKTIEGWSTQQDNFVNSVKTSALFQTVTSSLNGIRTNLFSPIYGVMSSLTKLVTNTFNSASSVFNSLITPVRNILRDIASVSNQAIALVNLVNNQIKGFGRNISGQLKGVESDFKTAIKTLGKAAGVIASAPISAAQNAKVLFSSGRLSAQSSFLQSTPKQAFVRPSLTILKKPVPTKISLLTGGVEFTAKTSNSL